MAPDAPLPPRRYDLQIGGCRVVLVGTIQGLKGEARHVQDAWDSFGNQKPQAILLGVPPEDVTNLKRIGADGVEAFMSQELDTGSYEDTLLPQLARFGDIAMPPDDLLLSEQLARQAGIPLIGIDVNDEAHSDLFVEHISGWAMVRGQARQKRWVAKVAPLAQSAEELVLSLDAEQGKVKGYRKFEEARTGAMWARMQAECGSAHRLLVVAPFSRVGPLAAHASMVAGGTRA